RPGQTRSFKYIGEEHRDRRFLAVLLNEVHDEWWRVLIIDDPLDRDEGSRHEALPHRHGRGGGRAVKSHPAVGDVYMEGGDADGIYLVLRRDPDHEDAWT